jgi:hypothetical protein
MKLYALPILLALNAPALAGEIIIGGRFENQTTGYEYGTWPADTSGAQAGTLIDFSSSLVYAGPKSISFDTPAYGEQTETFTTLASLYFTQAGEFYTLLGPKGWLSVNVINPGWGISSFSFTDVATALAPPPPIIPPPPVIVPPPVIIPPPVITPPICLVDCGPPHIIPIATPELSTWAMMLLGFVALGYAAFRRRLA